MVTGGFLQIAMALRVRGVLRSSMGKAKEESASAISRALGYPYDRPEGSFAFVAGEALPLGGGSPPEGALSQQVKDLRVEKDGREGSLAAVLGGPAADGAEEMKVTELSPVLAIGSNGAPEQLRRKFSGIEGAVIPALRCQVEGVDVAYAAGISNYGSVTATLVPSPGATLDSIVTMLSPTLLERMHQTEGAYHFYRLPLQTSLKLDGLYCYVHQQGALALPQPIALREVEARGRALHSLNQREVQEHIMESFGWGTDADDFVLSNVEDDSLRRSRVATLSHHALPFEMEGARRLHSIGSVYSRNVE